MKKIILVLSLILLPLAARSGTLDDVFNGRSAEISSYKTVQPRYGENRNASTVMIFVPEHLDRGSRVKVEHFQDTPENRKIRVLKLNRVLRFNTGLYDYAAMTSVFSAIQPSRGQGPWYPQKISISVSEWCGNFYQHLLPDGKGARRTMHSYFGTEGDRQDYIAAPPDGIYEDNLPVLIRELSGEFMAVGQKKKVNILPALWESRITHEPLSYTPGWIRKDNGPELNVAGTPYRTTRWTWQVDDRTVTYWTDATYPHTILKWEGSDGSRGELTASFFKPYWELNGNGDEALRKALGIL